MAKSAIQEVRDQLFLDRAVGKYLSNVSSNIGFSRPQFGFQNDALWRAVVRRGALDYRQVANLFEDWMTEIFGPKKTVSTVLSANIVLTDLQITVSDPTNIPQQGTLVIDEGLVTAQTSVYTFRDPLTGVIDILTAAPIAAPAALQNAVGYLNADVILGAVSLPLVSSTEFPIIGFNYTLLIDAGKTNEEVVQLTAHASDTAPLTISATTFAHDGPRPTPISSELAKVEGGGIFITLDSTANFPAKGLVRVQNPGVAGLTEIAEFFSNDITNKTLQLKTTLTNSYTLAAASVTLMLPGAKVQLAQVQVKGTDWDIFETQARKIQIYIPTVLDIHRLLDVSYIHDNKVANPASTIATGGATAGDFTLSLVDADAFPTAGAIQIAGATPEKIGFNRIDRFATNLTPISTRATGVIQAIAKALFLDGQTFTIDDGTNPASVFEFDIPPDGVANILVDISADVTAGDVALTIISAINGVGAGLEITARINPDDATQVLLANDNFGASGNTTSSDTVVDVTFTVSNMAGGMTGLAAGAISFYVQNASTLKAAFDAGITSILLSRGLAAEESRTVLSINAVTNKVTLTAVTGNIHLSSATVEMGDPRVLFIPQGLANNHLATDAVTLDEDEYAVTDLEIGDPTVAPADTARFQGPYSSSLFSRVMDSVVTTTLAENIAGPVDLLVDQDQGRSSLEVRDAILFETTGQFDLRIGRGLGSDETIDLTGITFRRATNALALVGATLLNATSFHMSAADIALLPNPPGGVPFGYRLGIEMGLVGEEIVVVTSIAGTSVTIDAPMTKAHADTSSVELLADVFELSEKLVFSHKGKIPNSQRLSSTPEHRPISEVNKVEEVRTSIQVAGIVGMPTTGGIVLLNFGKEQREVSSKLSAALVATGVNPVLVVSDDFPVVYPYFVEIDVGTDLAERKSVTLNVVGTETLTISPGADFAHPIGAEVRYDPGGPVELTFTGVDTGPNRLLFSSGILMEGPLLTGMPVILSSVTATPSTLGTDYPLYLPSTWARRLKSLFDRGRAAGVEIVTISSK